MGRPVLLLFTIVLSACAQERAGPRPVSELKTLSGPGTWDLTLTVGRSPRSYRLHLPTGFHRGAPVPLVIALHGMGSTGRQMERLTGLSELGDAKGFAVAYPDARKRVWKYWGRWGEDGAAPRGRVDDEDFELLKELAASLAAAGLTDPHRVYLAGISNGAYLALRAAVESADRFAAVGAVAGSLSTRMAAEAHPPRPVPLLYVHGTEDPIVSYDGRGPALGAEALVAWWARQNGCAAREPERQALPDAVADGTQVEKRSYCAADPAREVAFYRVVGGGHTWPGGAPAQERIARLGRTTRDFSASQAMWEFFARR